MYLAAYTNDIPRFAIGINPLTDMLARTYLPINTLLRSTICQVALLLFLFPTLTLNVNGQSVKKALDHDAYDIWNRIDEEAISHDGAWVLYSMSPENGDAMLHVKQSEGSVAYSIPRGVSAAFSADGRHVVAMVKPKKDSVRTAKIAKNKGDSKADDMPKDQLAILNLESGSITYVDRVKSYKLPEEAGGWVAYHLEKPEKKDESSEATEEEQPAEAPEPEAAGEEKEPDDSKKKDKQEGTPLVLYNLEDGSENTFAAATGYAFSENGAWLAYTASDKEGKEDGIYAVATATGTVTPILTGEGVYKKTAFDKASTQLAFLSNRDDYAADQPAFSLYHWTPEQETPSLLADASTAGIPDGWWVSEHGTVSFSERGNRVLFGTAPVPPAETDDETPEDEQVKLDVWNWKDPLLQPMQLVRLENERKRSYLAIVHLDDQRVTQVADQDVPEVAIGMKGDADIAVGHSNVPYQQEISWEWPGFYDVYVVDVTTGERRIVQKQVQSRAELSPNAGFLSWWDREERAWYTQPVEGGEPVNLTASLPHPVYNELHDWPFKPNPYGDAGWTDNDEAFLVYDRHDIWALDPKGASAPVNMTDGYGRASDLRFRYVWLDRDATSIDADAPMLLHAFDYTTKSSGFYRNRPGRSDAPEQLVMMERSFSTPEKAKDADKLLFTRESFEEFEDLWISDLNLEAMERISDANPQQSEYLWGTAELVDWVSLDGIPLQGMLFKPENFDPSQKYPMVVYFYEKMSDGLHTHRPPATARSSISFSFYASRGYLVFVPDIPYKVGYPGESALNAVVPGVTSLVEEGFVDEDNIGVQGHSWGGYQIAYMITETNLFKAAEAGAPVSNMTSAYGGIRWGSGMSRMFQYEESQSRIGGTLWEYPLRYLDNSPLFQADKIETPLLMMHNDKDGAVPWYQGIEMFVALRRLGKPVWMLNYNGEFHGLTKYHNKRDWAIRMQQFFDHYLQGAPAPVWMAEGVPALHKGKTLGLELITPKESVVTEEP